MKSRCGLSLLCLALAPGWASAQVPAGGEFPVTPPAAFTPVGGSVAAVPAGGFVVVVVEALLLPPAAPVEAGLGNPNGIFGQRFDAAGSFLASEFTVDLASITPVPARHFRQWRVRRGLVGPRAASSQDVFGRRFDAAAARVAPRSRSTPIRRPCSPLPRCLPTPPGNVVVAWSSNGPGRELARCVRAALRRGRLPAGVRVPGQRPDGQRPEPGGVAADKAGSFVVVWEDYGLDGGGVGVFAQRYDAAGVPRGSNFRSTPSRPAISASPGGVRSGREFRGRLDER